MTLGHDDSTINIVMAIIIIIIIMLSRLYVTVGRLYVRLSVPSIDSGSGVRRVRC